MCQIKFLDMVLFLCKYCVRFTNQCRVMENVIIIIIIILQDSKNMIFFIIIIMLIIISYSYHYYYYFYYYQYYYYYSYYYYFAHVATPPPPYSLRVDPRGATTWERAKGMKSHSSVFAPTKRKGTQGQKSLSEH